VPFNNALYYKAAYSYFADYQLCRYSEFPFGIAQQSMMNLSVYPNPTSGTFTVVLPKPTGNTTIEVYNSTGVLIRTQAAVKNVNTVDLTGRNAGLYILKVVSNGQTVGSQKVMKQ
jgi:hypothetical protein